MKKRLWVSVADLITGDVIVQTGLPKMRVMDGAKMVAGDPEGWTFSVAMEGGPYLDTSRRFVPVDDQYLIERDEVVVPNRRPAIWTDAR